MTERNSDIIEHIVAGWRSKWIRKKFGFSELQYTQFIENNSKRITFEKLKRQV